MIDPVGEGLPGVPVVIAGHATTTDSSGHFSVPNIQSPYEAVLSYTPLGRYLVYEGVKRLDPTFVVMSAGQWSSATASVTLGGNWSSADAGLRTDVAIHSSTVWFQGTGGTATASPYSMPLYWYGPPSGSANVFGLQWAQDSGVATSFLGFASTPVSVADGGSPSASLSFASVTSSTLSGTVTAPSNYTINSYNVGVVDWSQYAEDISFSYARGTAAGSDSFSFPVPNVGSPYEIEFVVGAEWMDLSTYQQHESSVRVNAPSSPVALTLPASSTLTAPAGVFSGPATNVTTSTTFAWTPVTGSFYEVDLVVSGSAFASVILYTNATTFTLPDLSTVGMTWASGSQYQWSVTGSPGTVDDVATFPQPDQLVTTRTYGWSFTMK